MNDKKSITDRFLEFHDKNPHVYQELLKLAREAKDKGFEKIGISMLYEVLRWNRGVGTEGSQGFKLSNDFRSRYARLIMYYNPDLRGLFSTKKIKTK